MNIPSLRTYVAASIFAMAAHAAPNTAAPTQAVTVANTTAQPVPVQLVNPPASSDSASQEKSPVFGRFLTLTMTGLDGHISFVQNSGKRAMIRHISIRCRMPSAEEVVVNIGGNFGLGPMSLALQSSFLKIDRAIAIASMPVNLMIDNGSQVDFDIERSTSNINAPGTASCQINLVGYTVPQPPL